MLQSVMNCCGLSPSFFQMICSELPGLCPVQVKFRAQFLLTGPDLLPWQYSAAFVAGLGNYLQGDPSISNIEVINTAPLNLTESPVRLKNGRYCCPPHWKESLLLSFPGLLWWYPSAMQ